jgi:hypothetical protein
MWIRNTGGSESAILLQTLNKGARGKSYLAISNDLRRSAREVGFVITGPEVVATAGLVTRHGHLKSGITVDINEICSHRRRQRLNCLLMSSATAPKSPNGRFSSLSQHNFEFFGLIPKSPTHTGLICVKNLEPNISRLGPFKKRNHNTVQRPKIKQQWIVFLQVNLRKNVKFLGFLQKVIENVSCSRNVKSNRTLFWIRLDP